MGTTRGFIDQCCQLVPVRFPTVFSWDYAHDDERLVRLYDKAKRAQWSADSDIAWGIEVDPCSQRRATA